VMCTCVCVGGEEECCHVGDSAGEGHERGDGGETLAKFRSSHYLDRVWEIFCVDANFTDLLKISFPRDNLKALFEYDRCARSSGTQVRSPCELIRSP
jgi:hypothetical protein